MAQCSTIETVKGSQVILAVLAGHRGGPVVVNLAPIRFLSIALHCPVAGLLPAVEAALLLISRYLYPALLRGAGISALHAKQDYAMYEIPCMMLGFLLQQSSNGLFFILFF